MCRSNKLFDFDRYGLGLSPERAGLDEILKKGTVSELVGVTLQQRVPHDLFFKGVQMFHIKMIRVGYK